MRRELTRHELVRRALLAGLLGGLYAVGALLPFWYTPHPAGGTAFFPSAGLSLSFLLLTPRRTWPLWLSVIGVTELIVDLEHSQPLGVAVGFAVANMVEPLVGASTLIRAVPRSPAMLRRFAAFALCGMVLGPAVGAVVGATTSVAGFGGNWLSIAGNWWLGDALGVLVVASLILAWSGRSPVQTSCSLLETIALATVATGVAIVPAVFSHHTVIYAVLPVLMVAALRGGTKAVSVAGMGVAFAADWVTVTGRSNDLIAASSTRHQLLYIQAFLAVTLLAAFLLAVDAADRQQAESQARLAESERNRAELLAATAAGDERRRITRDTHDIVGHALNVMLLQAGAARRMLSKDPEVSEELLVSMESIGREAFQDLDVALRLGESPDTTLNRGLDDVPKLVEEMKQSGLDVTMSVAGDPYSCRLSKLVDWSAYRIVEEAMTNIAKHAPAAHSEVSILYQPESVLLAVVDDGPPARPPNRQHVGRGLVGIRERASAVGARIEVGPQRPSGFAVRVWLPVAGSP